MAGGRRWQGFGAGLPPLAAQIAQRGTVARRARHLVENNPLAAAGAQGWVSALVGCGVKPQSAHPDPAVRAGLNAAWERWTDIADADSLADAYGRS